MIDFERSQVFFHNLRFVIVLCLTIIFCILGVLAVIVGLPTNLEFLAPFFLLLISLPFWYGLYDAQRIIGLGFGVLFVLLGIGVEAIGLNYGFIYGPFSYGGGLGLLSKGVPVVIGVAWSMLILSATAVVRPYFRSYFAGALASACLIVLIDLILDPGAVAFGYWSFPIGFFYGVSLHNFVGWFFVGFCGALVSPPLVSKGSAGWFVCSLLLLVSFWFGVVLALGYWVCIFIGCLLLALLIIALVRSRGFHES